MAKATTLLDDMTGEAGAKERTFSIGGVDYSIDLTDDSYRAFLLTLEPWRSLANVARKPRKSSYPPLSKDDRAKIRKWAEANDIDLAPRGRFPTHVVKAYYKDQGLELG